MRYTLHLSAWWQSGTLTTPNAGEDAETQQTSLAAGGHAERHGSAGRRCGGFSRNGTSCMGLGTRAPCCSPKGVANVCLRENWRAHVPQQMSFGRLSEPTAVHPHRGTVFGKKRNELHDSNCTPFRKRLIYGDGEKMSGCQWPEGTGRERWAGRAREQLRGSETTLSDPQWWTRVITHLSKLTDRATPRVNPGDFGG